MWDWLRRWLEGPPAKPPGWQEEWLHYSGPGREPHTREWRERKYRYREWYGWLWLIMLLVFIIGHGNQAPGDIRLGVAFGLASAFILRWWRQRRTTHRVLWPWSLVGWTIVVLCWLGHPRWAREATAAALLVGASAFVMQRIIRWFWKRRKWVAVTLGFGVAGLGGIAAWENVQQDRSPTYDYSYPSSQHQDTSLQGDGGVQSLPAGWGERRQLPPGDAGYYSWAASTNRFGDCSLNLVPEPRNTYVRRLRSQGYSAEDADDLTMEALIKTCEQYAKTYVGSLPAYYGGTMRNVVSDFARKGARRLQCDPYPPSCTPYDNLEEAEKRALLEWAACKLSRRQEWVLRLKMDGLSSRDIAAIRTQGGDFLSVDQVDNAWDAARKKLSQLISDRDGCW